MSLFKSNDFVRFNDEVWVPKWSIEKVTKNEGSLIVTTKTLEFHITKTKEINHFIEWMEQ